MEERVWTLVRKHFSKISMPDSNRTKINLISEPFTLIIALAISIFNILIDRIYPTNIPNNPMAGRVRRSSMSSREEERILNEYRQSFGENTSKRNELVPTRNRPKSRYTLTIFCLIHHQQSNEMSALYSGLKQPAHTSRRWHLEIALPFLR